MEREPGGSNEQTKGQSIEQTEKRDEEKQKKMKTKKNENQTKFEKMLFYFPLKHSMSYGQCFRTRVSDTKFQEDGQHGQKNW